MCWSPIFVYKECDDVKKSSCFQVRRGVWNLLAVFAKVVYFYYGTVNTSPKQNKKVTKIHNTNNLCLGPLFLLQNSKQISHGEKKVIKYVIFVTHNTYTEVQSAVIWNDFG